MDVTTVFPDGFLEKLNKLIKDDKNECKHEHYRGCVKHCEEMSWHVYGKKPVALLNRVRPREDPSITAYRLQSYEPITESICKKALSIVHKIFDSGLYSIRFKEGSNQDLLKDYSTEKYPRFNSVVNYLANFVLKKMMADPNAVLLVQPYVYDIKGSDRVQPIATCYHSKNVYLITDEYFLLFDEYIEQKTQSQTIKRWFFTYVDKVGIYKFSVDQTNTTQPTITSIAQYVHNFGEIPIWYLGGEYTDEAEDHSKTGDYEDDDKKDEGCGLYESFFHAAVPFWNEAINDHSDVTGGYRNHMWPHKWEIADECEYVEEGDNNGRYPCQGGYIFNGYDKHKCPGCHGSGYKTATSPYETTQVNRDKFNVEGPAGGQIPFGYVTVPTDALKMLEEKAERNLAKGLEALNMDVLNEIGLNQSGKAKEMDRTELNDFLQRIADVMFEIHLANIYYFFTRYMFGITNPEQVETIKPEISKPTQFDVYSSTELTDQFAKAKGAKLNPSYLRVKQAEIQNKELQTMPDLLAKLNLELTLDPLAEVNPEDVSLKLANGTITKETAIIHDNISEFVSRALEEDKNFIEKKRSEQIDFLLTYAAEVIKATRITIDTAALEIANQDPNNTNTKFDRKPVIRQ